MTFSFYELRQDGSIASMWRPQITGDWEMDNEIGRSYALEVINAMKQGESPPAVLGWIVRGFGNDESRKAVETGFCQQIAEAVLS